MQRHLIDYIRRPETMDAEATAHLQLIMQQYPYFHTARILMLQALHRQHSPLFDEELKHGAVLVPNRSAIFHLIEEPEYLKHKDQRRFRINSDQEDRSARTTTLIDNFLDDLPQESATTSKTAIDATQDYIGYLLQSEQDDKNAQDLPMNGDGVVEDFLQQDTGRIVLPDVDEDEKSTDTPNLEVTSNNSTSEPSKNEGKNEILTEIMAGIYIKQGKYENALKIIQQLSLQYPKKNRYFADQIRFLEKLIINNKNK